MSTTRRRPRAWRAVVELGGVFGVCVALLLDHPAGGALWHTLYAEDGHVFLQCRLDHGLSCLDRPYQGYLQVAPRLLIEPVPWLPIARWALVVSLAVVAVDSICLVIVYRASAWLLPARLPRALVVAVVAASGAAHVEVAGNTANLHWWLLLSAVVLAADRDADDRTGPTVLRTTWLVLVCLSEALTPAIAGALVAGLLLRRYRRGRWSPRDLAGAGVVLAAAVLEVVVALVEPRLEAPYPKQTVSDALHGYWRAVVHEGWSGPVADGRALGRIVVIGVSACVLAGVAGSARRRSFSGVRWLRLAVAVLLVAGSVADLVLSVLANDLLVPRYAFVPFALLVLAIFVAVATLFDGGRVAAAAPVLGGVAILVALLIIGPYPPLVATRGPSWSSQVSAGRRACTATPRRTSVPLTTAPNDRWILVVRCGRLTAGHRPG